MLNAVKHLYRIVDPKKNASQQVRKDAVETLRCVQYLALLMCLLVTSTSLAQTYSIKTLDGTNAVITIRNRAFTPFAISCSTDRLVMPNYWAGGEVKVLNKKFLEIIYYERGGTGVGTGNTLLLCINHGKLRQVMHIKSYSYNLGEKEITTNYTRLLLDAANTAHAIIYDTLEVKKSSLPNSITTKKASIKFNAAQRIFCNYQKKVNTTLGSYNYKTNQFGKRHFAGTVPAFQLDGCEYIFIGGRWYGKGGANNSYLSVN